MLPPKKGAYNRTWSDCSAPLPLLAAAASAYVSVRSLHNLEATAVCVARSGPLNMLSLFCHVSGRRCRGVPSERRPRSELAHAREAVRIPLLRLVPDGNPAWTAEKATERRRGRVRRLPRPVAALFPAPCARQGSRHGRGRQLLLQSASDWLGQAQARSSQLREAPRGPRGPLLKLKHLFVELQHGLPELASS